MLILCFGVQSVSRGGADLPGRGFVIRESISDIIIGTFLSVLPKTVKVSHLFVDILLGSSVPGTCPKGEMRGTDFSAVTHLTETGVDARIAELDEVLIGVDFGLSRLPLVVGIAH